MCQNQTREAWLPKFVVKGGLTGYRTNHSIRASAATCLFQAGVDEQIICDVTGHRSNAVRRYRRPTSEMRENVSSASRQGSASRPTYPAPTATVTRGTADIILSQSQ